ncbi:MAG: T9SS type A sorting domain-containing protein [Bacteroidota bacterium]|nr:T9SS type A sorting domain-containing protein [Bacteroidota bacterium]
MNSRRILSLAVLLFAIVVSGPTFAQNKNILRIRFETAVIKAGTTDIILKVFYKLEAPKPVSFRGFDCRFVYENLKIQPVTTFFDGTACQFADFAHGSFKSPDAYYVQVLSSAMLDTVNKELFEIRYSIKGFADSAMIEPTLFTPVDDDGKRIDTVIIENAPGRDNVGWYPFALMYADTTKPPPPPVKKSIVLSSDSTDIHSDSIRTISLNVSSLDSANVKSGIFEFELDTAAFDSVAVMKGALLTSGILSLSRDSTHIVAKFSNADTSKSFASAGELLKILLRGKKLTDTVCSAIVNPKLTVLNADNLVSSVTYKLQGICVFGHKDTVITGFVGSEEEAGSLTASPNPAHSFIDFHMPDHLGNQHLVVFDALGKKVYDAAFDEDFRWNVASIPAGLYTATVIDFSALETGAKADKQKILIIH